MKKLFRLILLPAFVFEFCFILRGQQNMVDAAVSDAALKTIKKMNMMRNTANIKNIAFLGLQHDRGRYSSLFQSALSSQNSRFNFFSRNEELLGILTEEIEFGEKREDVMRQETIQKFGKLEGVEALMFGSVLEAGLSNSGDSVFRVALVLVEIETGKYLWGGQITGLVRELKNAVKIPEGARLAAIDAGKRLNNDLMLKKSMLPSCNIFVMPFAGTDADGLSEIIVSQLSRNFGKKLNFYANPDFVDKIQLDDIKIQTSGSLPAFTSRQLKTIGRKLKEVYGIDLTNPIDSKYGSNKVNAYLQGIVSSSFDSSDQTRKVSVDIQLRDLASNKLLWSSNVTGIYQENEKFNDNWLRHFWNNNKTWVTIAMIVAGVICLLIGLLIFGLIVMKTFSRR